MTSMATRAGSFSGELGVVGLFDLGHLLMLNRASGTLTVTAEGRRSTLSIREGKLVNAVDDRRKQGLDAAYRVFMIRAGMFEFRPGKPAGEEAIDASIEAIMLEAARRMDEESGDTGATRLLLVRQTQFDALRDEFHRVTSEAVSEARRAPSWSDPWLDSLQVMEDRLLFRPEAEPRLFRQGRWDPPQAEEAPLDVQAYEELRVSLMSGVALENLAEDVRRRVVSHRGRRYGITWISGLNEAMWVSLADVDAGVVAGKWEALDAVLDEPSATIFAAAPTLDEANRLLRMLVARVASRRGTTLVVITEDASMADDKGTGLVLAVSAAESERVIRAARPGIVALDAACPLGAVILPALSAAPFVLAGVVAPTPEAVIARWLVRFPSAELPRATTLVSSAPAAVMMASRAAGTSALSFTVHRVTPPTGALSIDLVR